VSQIIIATLEDGVLKPSEPLDLPARAQVRLTVELLGANLPEGHPMSGIYEIPLAPLRQRPHRHRRAA
jgi:predicted DNA-binding antitoxin AbrB/MazE fold protein